MKASEIIDKFKESLKILDNLFDILNVEHLDLSCEEFEILVEFFDDSDVVIDIFDKIDTIIDDLLPALDIDEDCEEDDDDE